VIGIAQEPPKSLAELALAGLLALPEGKRTAAVIPRCSQRQNPAMVRRLGISAIRDLVRPDIQVSTLTAQPFDGRAFDRYSQNYSQNREYRLFNGLALGQPLRALRP
jgi:hypothetical protein